MTTLTIRPGSANSTSIGGLRSSDATYATARGGTGTFTSIESAPTISGGQRLLTGTYDLNEMFFGFPVGSAVAGAVVLSAVFEWTTNSANVSGGLAQAILAFDAGNIQTGDWQDGTELAALASWGSIPGTGFQTNSTTYQVSLNATAIASIQTTLRAGGTVAFMVVAQAQVDNTAPVGNNRYDILSEQDATAGNRPALIINYTIVGDNLLSGSRLSRPRLVG